jgi:hypothetical protein
LPSAGADALVVVDDLVDNETEEFFGKIRIEIGRARQLAEPLDLRLLARRISRPASAL